MELRVQQMMEAQDSRFQDMLKQVLKTVAEGPHLSAAAGAYPMPSEHPPGGFGEQVMDLTGED